VWNGHAENCEFVWFACERAARRNHVTQFAHVRCHFVTPTTFYFTMTLPNTVNNRGCQSSQTPSENTTLAKLIISLQRQLGRFCFWLAVFVCCFIYSVSQQILCPLEVFLNFSPNSWEVLSKILYAYCMFISSDVKRGSKNRNSLQFRVLEIEFLNPKLDFTFWISANVTIFTLIS